MAQALDYSAGFPGAQAIKRAGYAGAVRYIGFADRRKCTTKAELDDFDQQGIGMALVFEGAATDWRGGFGAGQVNGRRGRDHANAIGFSADRPIYMAVDQDVVSSGEFTTMVEYLRGAGTSLGGPGRTGVYGEADVIDRARDAGVASWFWQTAAWSRGRRTSAHLFQHVGAVTVGGIACDINDVLSDDWGQHNGGDMSIQDVVDGLDKWFKSKVDSQNDGRNLLDGLTESNRRIGRIDTETKGLASRSAGAETTLGQIYTKVSQLAAGGLTAEAVAAALAPLISAGATPEQVQEAVNSGVRQAFARAGQ